MTMITTPSPSLRTAFAHFLVLGAFLSVAGLALSEVLLSLQQVLSARVFAFAVSVVLCWLVLDNVVLAADLSRTTQNTSTDCERELLRRLAGANQRFRMLRRQLDEESAFHRETAARLDKLEEDKLALMHWGMLAAKTAALNNIQQMVMRRRRGVVNLGRRSKSESENLGTSL